jgi:quercetin dioxygenase-like cupin family protein
LGTCEVGIASIGAYHPAVELRTLADVEAFTTKDGSTIRELHHTAAQSLAEATLEPGQATQRHYHARSEEIYLITDGGGDLEVDGVSRAVRPGDAIVIPPGAWHELTAGAEGARLLCMCVPPYSHDDTYFSSELLT